MGNDKNRTPSLRYELNDTMKDPITWGGLALGAGMGSLVGTVTADFLHNTHLVNAAVAAGNETALIKAQSLGVMLNDETWQQIFQASDKATTQTFASKPRTSNVMLSEINAAESYNAGKRAALKTARKISATVDEGQLKEILAARENSMKTVFLEDSKKDPTASRIGGAAIGAASADILLVSALAAAAVMSHRRKLASSPENSRQR